jgi:hypothetical protein
MISLCACLALLWAAVAQAQSAPIMNQEPHHQRLTYIRHMRVFHLTLAPGESTADYVLDHDTAMVALTDGAIRTFAPGGNAPSSASVARGRADLRQITGAPVTQRIENAGSAPLRAVVVENLRDKGWTTPPPLMGPGTTLQTENRGFAVYDMRLSATAKSISHTHQNPSFIFVMSGAVMAQGGGGEFEFPLEPAKTWWFPGSGADQPHTLTLPDGGTDAHVICVEAR